VQPLRGSIALDLLNHFQIRLPDTAIAAQRLHFYWIARACLPLKHGKKYRCKYWRALARRQASRLAEEMGDQ